MTPMAQLEQWVQGNSVHDDEHNICCPDFSCCTGKLADEDVRLRFKKAYEEDDQETQHQMLMMFLGGAFSGANIAGGRP